MIKHMSTRLHADFVYRRISLPVAALPIDKVGPRPYHFRSGSTTRPHAGSQKSKTRIYTEIFNMLMIGHFYIYNLYSSSFVE